MKNFTHYWRNDTWEFNRSITHEGELLDHIAGNIFVQRGVEIGDTIYVVTVSKGKLYLCCKIIASKIKKTVWKIRAGVTRRFGIRFWSRRKTLATRFSQLKQSTDP